MSTIALTIMLVTAGAPDQNGYAIAASHPGIVTYAACDCGRRSYPRLPGSHDHVRRLPAYHGTYYRRPTDYRNQHDYPWHARLCPPMHPHAYPVPLDSDEFRDEESPPSPPAEQAEDAVDSDRTVMRSRVMKSSGMKSSDIGPSVRQTSAMCSPRRVRPPSVSDFERAVEALRK